MSDHSIREIYINIDEEPAKTDGENKAFEMVKYTRGYEDTSATIPNRYIDREKITKPDDWSESTPTIVNSDLQPYIEAVKRSSQSAIKNGLLCALEVLALKGIHVSDEIRDEVENEAGDICTKYIRDTAEDHNRWLHKQLAELTAELIHIHGEKKKLTKKLVKQKKAILDFTRDDDLNKLKEIVYGETPKDKPSKPST